jgi:hypothetical protein
VTLFNLQAEIDAPLTKARKVRRETKPNGYAWRPGTGPANQTCGSCAHIARIPLAKTYLKCGVMRAHWTGGRGTDILARSPACREWKEQGASD